MLCLGQKLTIHFNRISTKVSKHDRVMTYANCGAIAVITSMTYMTIVELFDEYPTPFSPWDDDDDSH